VTTVPWGVAYTNAIIGWVDPVTGVPYPPGVRVHPTPIYEFLQSVIVFMILWSLRKKGYPSGTMFWLYLILTGVMRFIVEFWRVNTVLALNLTEAQWFGLATMLVGAFLLYTQSMKPAARPARQ
ncbi:MAG: prolipoprotein diacylglyceryl transferase family protein, partial [Candidatus Binatia bacterium]